jgi:hypothetical protein
MIEESAIPPVPTRCQVVTKNDSGCKRIPANGEPYCFLYGQTLRHRWRALSKLDAFVLAAVLAALAFASVQLLLQLR